MVVTCDASVIVCIFRFGMDIDGGCDVTAGDGAAIVVTNDAARIIEGSDAGVGEDNVVIETGGERNKLRLKNWAIAENISAMERAKAASPKKNASPLASAALVDDTDKKSKKKKKNDEE